MNSTPRILNKFATLRESVTKELQNSSYLMKIGSESDIGSDSEPEKGELTEKNTLKT